MGKPAQPPQSLGTWLTRLAESAVRVQETLDAAWWDEPEEGVGAGPRGALVEHALAGRSLAGRELAGRYRDLWYALAPPRPVVSEIELGVEVELRSTREREAGGRIGLAVVPLGISVFARHRYERMRAGRLKITVARVEPEAGSR